MSILHIARKPECVTNMGYFVFSFIMENNTDNVKPAVYPVFSCFLQICPGYFAYLSLFCGIDAELWRHVTAGVIGFYLDENNLTVFLSYNIYFSPESAVVCLKDFHTLLFNVFAGEFLPATAGRFFHVICGISCQLSAFSVQQLVFEIYRII